jgi:hypothetical protein
VLESKSSPAHAACCCHTAVTPALCSAGTDGEGSLHAATAFAAEFALNRDFETGATSTYGIGGNMAQVRGMAM